MNTLNHHFVDQIEADKAGEDFLLLASELLGDKEFSIIEWHNFERADGRVGTLRIHNNLVAIVTVVRDTLNMSDVVMSFLATPRIKPDCP